MRGEREIDCGTVSFEAGKDTDEQLYNTVLNWFLKEGLFCGESIQQSDAGYIEGIELISTLADEVFKFDTKYNE